MRIVIKTKERQASNKIDFESIKNYTIRLFSPILQAGVAWIVTCGLRLLVWRFAGLGAI
ncbi:MAG: hypothetical protein H7Y10_02820 [Flavobacterium sp.]|nr:hypothetical protein [Flavobacterium sp.]